MQRIAQILFPRGVTTQSQRNDVEIVFNSSKYFSPLITNDGASKSQPGGILGNRVQLSQIGIKVLTPEEAVSQVEKQISQRDKYAREWAEHCGKELPYWVGQD